MEISIILKGKYLIKHLTNELICVRINNCVETSLQPHGIGYKRKHLNGES